MLLADALLKYETLDFEDVKNLLSGKKMKIESNTLQRKVIDVPGNSEEVPVDIPKKNVL